MRHSNHPLHKLGQAKGAQLHERDLQNQKTKSPTGRAF
jgi:hypothetical protein